MHEEEKISAVRPPDATDLRILGLIQENAKLTTREIAASLHLTATPVYERIKRLERTGYIRKYAALLDREKLGLHLMAVCHVSLKEHQTRFIHRFELDIQQFPEVVECYHLAGLYDYLLKVVVTDMDSYQQFVTNKLAALDNIGKVQSSFVLAELRNDHSLPLPTGLGQE